MKRVIALTLLFLFATHSFAYTLDERIVAIKSAPPAQRLELMNNLKRSIAKLNSQQRMRAIRRLRAKIAPHTLSDHSSMEHVVHSHIMHGLDSLHLAHRELMDNQEKFQDHVQKKELEKVSKDVRDTFEQESKKDRFKDSRR